MITEAIVRQALDRVIDPCSRASGCSAGLDSMGLVRQVLLSQRADGCTDVRVVIGVTEYGCLMGAPFASQSYRELESLAGVGEVQVLLDAEFEWDPSDMSPDYAQRLAEHRARAGIPVRVHRRERAATRP